MPILNPQNGSKLGKKCFKLIGYLSHKLMDASFILVQYPVPFPNDFGVLGGVSSISDEEEAQRVTHCPKFTDSFIRKAGIRIRNEVIHFLK